MQKEIIDDDVIWMKTVLERPNSRVLTKPHYCLRIDGGQDMIFAGFEWDGSSVPAIFQGLFPRHKHPIASCRHDWRCGKSKNATERKWADEQFKKDVGQTSGWFVKNLGYLGVRIGALFKKWD